MPNLTDAAYRYAEGRCMDALVQLRRQEGTTAIESLRAAIKAIEDDQRRVKRIEDDLRRVKRGRRSVVPVSDVHF